MLKTIKLTKPTAEYGMGVNQLIANCPPLDTNSIYCNLLQTEHFSDTSVAALLEGQLVGFVSGYIIPSRPNTLFVWQVAVGNLARGQGLAKKMLLSLLERSNCRHVTHIETTITQSNEGSWALFRSLAKQLNATLEDDIQFAKDTHFQGKHDTEYLIRIGPIQL